MSCVIETGKAPICKQFSLMQQHRPQAFLPNLLHDRRLAGHEVLCPKLHERRQDVQLLGFPSHQGLKALPHLQELYGLQWPYIEALVCTAP